MKRGLLSLILVASVLLGGASAGAVGLQAEGDSSASDSTTSSDQSGITTNLQPAGQVSQGTSGDNLSSSSVSSILGASSGQNLNTGSFNKQEILGEGDPSAPANGSSDWLPITFFVLLGLAVVLAGYLAFVRFLPAFTKP